MPLFNIREIISYPPGANNTDVLINNIHFNRTALEFYNYTLYSNHTLSNSTNCWLTFDAVQPSMLSNGTFINGTSCYQPYNKIRARGSVGILSACLFGISIMFTLMNLRKHGRRFLPNEKRFRAVGRRWQWYWMLFVAACGLISGIAGIDVDRDYLQSIAIVLQSFFSYLMIPGILATVWEAVRHWGSWQERQIYDYDPFSLPQDDRRGTKEFYIPLIFYLFAWLNFFMTIPRPWTPIEYQRSPQQTEALAKPAATDARFKAGSLFALMAWCTICYSLRHSIHHYKPKNHGPLNSFRGFLQHCPFQFLLAIPLLLIIVGYNIASSFIWKISPLKFDGDAGWVYGLGSSPAFLIIVIFEIRGYLEPNEDRALIAQRTERGRAHDAELGLTKKPSWWGKLSGDRHLTTEQRLKALTTEVGGVQATPRNAERMIELDELSAAHASGGLENPFRDEAAIKETDKRPAPSIADSDGSSGRAMSEGSLGTTASRPQQIRSMLDV